MAVEDNIPLATERKLLELLSNEIARDGGVSQVAWIKDFYVDKKIVDLLLCECCPSPKLLSFIEKFPDVFAVDRSQLPHTVQLLSRKYTREEDATERIILTAAQLYERIMYVLRQRQSKLDRRHEAAPRRPATTDWLLAKCKRHVHLWSRLQWNYLDNEQERPKVGTIEWRELVLPELVAFLSTYPDEFRINEDDNKVSVELVDALDLDDSILTEIAALLERYIVQAGGINLGLLLHLHDDLRRLLGGRDLPKLIESYPDIFANVQVTMNNGDFYVLIKKTNVNDIEGRLKTDEEGLFSVTNARYAMAMANVLAQAYIATTKDAVTTNLESVLAVDLTAGVGGMTVALSKTFSKVLAVEVDPTKAELCRKNLQEVDSIVQVQCVDAMEIIPTIEHRPAVGVLDPPWGGLHYRRAEVAELSMGSWPFIEVVVSLATHWSTPLVVGLKLPVTFHVEHFVNKDLTERAEREELPWRVKAWSIKKLGPQLFVVLHFYDKDEAG